MSPEELLKGHQMLWDGKPSGIEDTLFLQVVQGLHSKIDRMGELEDQARAANNDWAFTNKMEKESYMDALWIFLKTVDDLNPKGICEAPMGTVVKVTAEGGGSSSG
jgi:hypothetical protein